MVTPLKLTPKKKPVISDALKGRLQAKAGAKPTLSNKGMPQKAGMMPAPTDQLRSAQPYQKAGKMPAPTMSDGLKNRIKVEAQKKKMVKKPGLVSMA